MPYSGLHLNVRWPRANKKFCGLMWRLCAKHSAAGSSGLRCGARGGSQEVQNTQRRHSQACRATRWRFLYISYISKADPWAIHVCCLLTCRDETSPPCRRVTVSSRHHCGPPLSLVQSIPCSFPPVVNKQRPFFTQLINTSVHSSFYHSVHVFRWIRF